MIAGGEDECKNFYQLIFSLSYHFKLAPSELDRLMPYELEIYVSLLEAQLEQEKLERQQNR